MGIFHHQAFAQAVILENFSSAQCNASPQSDENIKALLEKDKDVFLLTCPIALGSGNSGDQKTSELCSERMIGYVLQYPLTRMPSTPNIVVNGRYQTVGTYPKIFESAIKLAHFEKNVMPISLHVKDNSVDADLPPLDDFQNYDLWFFAYDKSMTVTYERNDHTHGPDGSDIVSEKTLKIPYTFQNAVKFLKNLGEWSGAGENIVVPLHDFKADGFVILAQEKNYGPVIAAGRYENP
jgi:hypothetical protein